LQYRYKQQLIHDAHTSQEAQCDLGKCEPIVIFIVDDIPDHSGLFKQ